MSLIEQRNKCKGIHLVLSFLVLVSLIAVVNLIYARSQIRSRVGERPIELISRHGEQAAALGWPSATPEEPEWPLPDVWVKYVRKGQLEYYASADDLNDNAFTYFMHVQYMGWPLSVLEVKETMRKRHNTVLESSPAQGEPRPTIMLIGAIATPMIFGVPLWCLLWGAISGFLQGRVRSRRRRGLCVFCAYEIEQLERCPECGAATQPVP